MPRLTAAQCGRRPSDSKAQEWSLCPRCPRSGTGQSFWEAVEEDLTSRRAWHIRARSSSGAGMLDTSHHISNGLQEPRGKGRVTARPLPGEVERAQVPAAHTWEAELPTRGSVGTSAQSWGSGECHPCGWLALWSPCKSWVQKLTQSLSICRHSMLRATAEKHYSAEERYHHQ